MYVFLFVAIAIVYAGYAWYTYKKRPENFEDSSSDAAPAAATKSEDASDHAHTSASAFASASAAKTPDPPKDGVDDVVKSRKYVMRIFDVVLHRKPSDAELEKYAAFGSESSIVNAIVRDQDAATASPPPAPAPVAEAKHVASSTTPEASPSSSVEYHEFGLDFDNGQASHGGKVCLDRSDLLARLDTIRKEVLQFTDLVKMM
jgi:hypothetical protein